MVETAEQSSIQQPKKKKKTYTTVVVESPIAASRTEVWAALLDLINAKPISSTDGDSSSDSNSTVSEFGEVMSNEPPWRYVYSRPDSPTVLCECGVTIRDDGDTCNIAWSALIDPLTNGNSDEFIASIRPTFEGYLETLVERTTNQP